MFPPPMSPFSILPSTIHGEGLFATVFIPAGTHLGRYEGPVVDEDGPHVLWVWDDEDNLLGIDGENDLRYVNHSRDPNVEFIGPDLFALRDIRPGEELTHHYGEDWN